ncbi:MAG: Holliday junction branch migration DNA helicase RuvB [Deltaproteobacteria bacterium]|nr:MAG: Holliday junction branch migration DNA helicase RuvB [Deltaproteobacteria bacterium]
MARQAHVDRDALDPREQLGEVELQNALRPQSFADYVGQRELLDNLRVFVAAARKRGEALDHILFAGPPGLGKTTLAHVIANEMGVRLHTTSGPAIDHKGALAQLLTSLSAGDVLFIDEIHRLSPVVEENLYPAMEDFRFDFVLGEGPHAKTVNLTVPPFTLLGATTRVGLLTGPLHNRFGFHAQLSYYGVDDLTAIVSRSARLLGVPIDAGGAAEIAGRSRGTPRIANRLLRRVRDFAEVEGDGSITRPLAASALDRLQVDQAGLDRLDRTYLTILVERFDGGPVGVEALAASMSEERGTLEEVIEPFLLQEGFIARTSRGRVANRRAFEHLGVPAPERGGQGALF